jgi:23S rRNA (pseudouridine1915-N3)-methyltransferase
MRTLRFIWVGKLKEPFWRDAASHYWTRLGRFFRLKEVCVKDGSASEPASRSLDETGRLIAQIKPQDYCIALDERGSPRSSKELAAALDKWTCDANRIPCFLIGGPFGLTEAALERSQESLRLSRMTFTHETARVLLLEQLYRGATILKGLPYHHA